MYLARVSVQAVMAPFTARCSSNVWSTWPLFFHSFNTMFWTLGHVE
jgi:hypothetical protein